MYKEKLPYSQSALILGISSIITACCCWGVIGIILGIIGLNNANKAIRIHEEDPDMLLMVSIMPKQEEQLP